MQLFKRLTSSLIASAMLAQVAYAFNGDATWFNVGLGSCGVVNVNSDFIVALSTVEMAGGASCGRQIRVNYQGRSVVATVRDTCPSCSQFSIDLSPAAFQALASLDVGRIQVEWDFI